MFGAKKADGEEEGQAKFDYKALAARLSPRGSLDSNNLIKIGDINLVHKMIAEKEKEIQSLHGEVYKLQDQYKNQYKDREDVILKLTKENDFAMKKMIDLENKIQNLEKKNEKLQNEAVNNFDTKKKQLEGQIKEEIKDIQIKTSEQNEELEKKQDIAKEKLKYELELITWRQDCASLEKTIAEEKKRIDIERKKMMNEKKAKQYIELDEFKLQAKKDAQRSIQEIERRIHFENQELTEKTMALRYILNGLKQKHTQTKEKDKINDRNMNLLEEQEEAYAKRGLAQQKKTNELKEKIIVLEKSLQQIVLDFEKEKELLKFQHEQIIKEQQEDITNLKRNLQLKNQELENVRALSQVVLNQRSQVEQFFLEALEQIKDEIKKKVAQERKAKKAEFGGLFKKQERKENTSLGMGQDSKTTGKVYNDKVDLNDLDWEDRERVLRLLFSKINAGVSTNAARIQEKQAAKHNGQVVQYQDNNQFLMITPEMVASLREFFEQIDRNGDGLISLEEAIAAFQKEVGLWGEKQQSDFYACDTNDDGKVSFEEFLAKCLE